MITVRLNGGLANQMFEYAMARTVAYRRRTAVQLEFRSLNADRKRCYSLGAWNIHASPASVLDLSRIYVASRLDRALRPSRRYYERPIVREQSFCFDANALNAPDNSLLIGFWQSNKYFREIEPLIRGEFTLRSEPSPRTIEVARAIRASNNSVFLHVRRGDYLSDPTTNTIHGMCSLQYYVEAFHYIARAVADAHFFVFSDEPTWTRDNLKLPFPITVVDHNPPGNAHGPGREHEDLWLMSQCRHAILANSSFSWWGAWLNPERGRIVIAPQRWFQSPQHDTRDLIPDTWIRI